MWAAVCFPIVVYPQFLQCTLDLLTTLHVFVFCRNFYAVCAAAPMFQLMLHWNLCHSWPPPLLDHNWVRMLAGCFSVCLLTSVSSLSVSLLSFCVGVCFSVCLPTLVSSLIVSLLSFCVSVCFSVLSADLSVQSISLLSFHVGVCFSVCLLTSVSSLYVSLLSFRWVSQSVFLSVFRPQCPVCLSAYCHSMWVCQMFVSVMSCMFLCLLTYALPMSPCLLTYVSLPPCL